MRTDKRLFKILRKAIRKHEKIVCDEKEDNIEYLKDNIDQLKSLKISYFDKNKYHEYRAKYVGTDETIRYLLKDYDEYLEKIMPELINLITKNYETELNVNLVFGSKNNPNDGCNLFITTKSTDIDEVFDQLIKKSETIENIVFLLKGVESIAYSFTKIIIKNTFVKSPDWIKNKKCTINSQNKDNKCFQYSITISLYHKEIKNNPERTSKIKPLINNLNWENINFPPEEQDYKIFKMNNKSIALNILQINEQKISHFYKSEFNKTREKQVILLVINDDNFQKHHYFGC